MVLWYCAIRSLCIPTKHSLFESMLIRVVFSVSVLAIERSAYHGSHVVRMLKTTHHMNLDSVGTVRIEAPLQKLEAVWIFNDHWTESIPHSDSLLFSVFDSSSFVPVPRHKIWIESMDAVNGADVDDPHAERTVTVNCIFLEISVHFVLNYFDP